MEHRLKSLAVIAALVAAVAATLSPRKPAHKVLCDGFLPPNHMKIPVGDVRALGIDQVTFNQVMDRIQEVYGPIVAAHGGSLQINRLWDDPTVNASAEQQGNTWILNMYGGLARHRAVNYDGMMLVACHEMGHHLGGYPLYNGGDWAANEGQADYFGAAKCLRKTLGAKAVDNLDPFAKAGCDKAQTDADGRKKCYVAAEAGFALADLLGELGGTGTPAYNTPDPSQVAQTEDGHPAAQCRLDTYWAGGLCKKSENDDFSRTSGLPGACNQSEGATVGYRPRCWYKPAEGVVSKDVAALSLPKSINEKTVEARLKSLRAALSGGR